MSKFNWDNINMDTKGTTNTPQAIGSMTEESCMKVIEKVKDITKTDSKEMSMLLIAGLCQRGGTNKNISGTVMYQISDKQLTAQQFQKICQDTGKGTPRQFARTMAQDIVDAAKILNEEGDLARQMRLEFPKISSEEAIWCSNYQGSNPNCPETVRKWLVFDQRRRFGR